LPHFEYVHPLLTSRLPTHWYQYGSTHLSHGALSATYDTSSTSLSTTHALAWYAGVKHEVKPITSGYRLALSYNVFHTLPSPRPALPTTNPTLEALRVALTAWNACGGDGPEKLVSLLKHKYLKTKLSAAAMKGSDAQTVGALAALAEDLGFRFGFARLEREERGQAEDKEDPDDREDLYGREDFYGREERYGRGYWDEDKEPDKDDDDDDDDVEMGEVDEVEQNFEDLVDEDGKDISSPLEVDDDEMVPAGFDNDLGVYDDQKHEGYQVRPSSRRVRSIIQCFH
jgi:hypothetical protein